MTRGRPRVGEGAHHAMISTLAFEYFHHTIFSSRVQATWLVS